VAYEGTATPTSGWRRIGGLATAITVSTIVAGVGGLVATFVSASASTDAEEFLAGSISEEAFEDVLAPVNSLQLLVTVATLTTAVLTIIWMYRIATNVRSAGRSTTWHPAFAIFGWFLPPGVLYVIPFLVLRELWKASAPETHDGGDGWRRSADNPVLWLWFALFGLVTAVLFAVQLASGDLESIAAPDTTSVAEGLADIGALTWVSPLVTLAAAGAWVVFVRQLTDRHRRLTNET
jgi:hypothetical protein